MAKFGYVTKRQMDPRPGRTYATEYYKQSAAERRRTHEHVEAVIKKVCERALSMPGGTDLLTAALPRFQRRETKGAYSAHDIMKDMLDQMISGKDVPSGMLGRWNRLFENTGDEIDMIPESELPHRNPMYKELFDDR